MKRVKRTANVDLVAAAKQAGVYQWEIADRLNLSEAYLSRALRYEFSDEAKMKYFSAIKTIAEERKEKKNG